jgi:bifunctional UDP-N-acetylglucosamine pyrophosphorylase/glucosamine-1-phosphate N-acetyltransferase
VSTDNAASPAAVIILAAGEGTRMKSARLPKVLHGFAGRSLLGHALAAAEPLHAAHTVVVVGHRRAEVTAALAEIAPNAQAVVQAEQRGTGHAVRIAIDALPPQLTGTIVVLPGDAPLLTAQTLQSLVDERGGAAAALLTSVAPDPTGYGRVLRGALGRVIDVVEHKDASAEQRALDEVAAGVYAFDAAFLRDALSRLTTANAQGEEYLPDVIKICVSDGQPVAALVAAHEQTAGVNDRVQLAAAARVYNDRLLAAHMRAGVSVLDPGTTWVDASVHIDADATLLPGVDLHGSTTIGAGARIGPQTSITDSAIGADSRLERTVANQARIGARVTVGPFAYLRPGTVLADDVHVGTYVEIKASEIGVGSKVPHLSYVGDASIGEHTNIGAATVFVNYDGVAKFRSSVGNHARTGADNMFVAPVQIGDGAYTAAGSVITEDVPPGAMAIARGRQHNVAGWVARNRAGTAAATAAEAATVAAAEAPTEAAETSPLTSEEESR